MALFCAAILGGSVFSKAQTVTKSAEFSAFSSVEANYEFEVIIKSGEFHKVEWVVDEVLADLVKIHQQGSVLKIDFDTKALTKDHKKHYKGKEAPRKTLKVTIHTHNIEGIKVKDKVHLDASGATFEANGFNLTMEGETTLNSLTIHSNNANIETKDKAVANLSVDSKKINIKGGKKSSVKLNIKDCDLLVIDSDNDFSLDVKGDVNKDAYIEASGSSNICLKDGKTPQLTFICKNSAELDATDYNTEKCELVMSGGKAYINASDEIKLELKSGSSVSFMNKPKIEIVKIEKSNVTPFNGKK